MADDLMRPYLGKGPSPRMPAKLDYEAAQVEYDADEDVLYLMFVPTRPASTVDYPDGVWLRIDPVTGEIFGIEIQEFERGFLKPVAPLAADWARIKGYAFDTLPSDTRVRFVKRLLKRANPTARRPSVRSH